MKFKISAAIRNAPNNKSLRSTSKLLGWALTAFISQPLWATTPAGGLPSDFSVNEQTISFNYLDWFQVQDASTYATLCEGFNDCTVPSGEYIIINHTTGDRFNDIRVGESTQPVENGVIIFPGEGWYQVQEAYTFQSICEGGTSCTVPPGTWIVINHTTGERTIQVVTGNGGGNGGGSGDIVVDGQTISWPNDGWYQVQNAKTFATVCEGGSSCSVAANGAYIVINLTTGQRWENITVGGGSPVEPPVNPGVVTVEGNTIKMPGNAWYQVQNKADLSTVCEGVMECVVGNGVYIVINHSTGQRDEFIIGSKVTADNALELIQQALEVYTFDAYDSRIFADFNTDDLTLVSASETGLQGSGTYSCSNGGTAVVVFTETGSVQVTSNASFTYNDCVVNGESRNGEVYLSNLPGNTPTPVFYRYNFTNYETDILDTALMEVSGEFGGSFADPDNLSTSWQNLLRTDGNPIDYVITFEGRTLSISDSSTLYSVLRPYSGDYDGFEQKMTGSLTMVPTFSNDVFKVNADMFGYVGEDENTSEIQFQSGSLLISSDNDGSYVELVPDTGDINTVAVRIGSGNPTVVQETVYRWTDLPFYNILVN